MKEEIVIWKFVISIIIIGCLSIDCYNSKATNRRGIYLERMEREDYIIQKDATTLANWSNYCESVIKYNESDGSFFGPSLLRYGGGPRSSDEKGFYLDVMPNHEYALFFENITQDKRAVIKWACILVRKRSFSQTIELLIPYDDIYRVLREGIYRVYAFKNEELILKGLYFL